MSRTEDLIRRSQAGDREAAQTLVQENTGLIWSVARRFLGRGTEADDLYQLGCLGFLKAVEGFDLEFGTQFSTYAVPKISGEIRRFLRDDGADVGADDVRHVLPRDGVDLAAVRAREFAYGGLEARRHEAVRRDDLDGGHASSPPPSPTPRGLPRSRGRVASSRA